MGKISPSVRLEIKKKVEELLKINTTKVSIAKTICAENGISISTANKFIWPYKNRTIDDPFKTIKANSLNCLAVTHPHLLEEWEYKLNKHISPRFIKAGSEKKAWWKCPKGEDHIWEASIYNRKNGQGCPICAGKKVVQSNCLATKHPEIALQWHPTKNKALTPYNITAGSHKKVWWKCPKGEDHEWPAMIRNRMKGKGCPVCAGKRVVNSNCIATTHPEIAAQWHPTLNKALTPYKVAAGSHKKVWWKCPKSEDHIYISTIYRRCQGGECSVCTGRTVVRSNSLKHKNPNLAKEWHPTKNGKLTPLMVTVHSTKKVWWQCLVDKTHEWEMSVTKRSSGGKCEICKKKVKSLAESHPEIAAQLHTISNGKLTSHDITCKSSKKVWWQCINNKSHKWLASARNRISGEGCQICSGKIVTSSNCLAKTHPEIAKQWHLLKNGELSPEKVTSADSSSNKYWWKCPKGEDHEWKASIYDRLRGYGCGVCSGNVVVNSNCLANVNPDVAKDWHPNKNGDLTPSMVTASSSKKVWWKCNKGDDHEWIMSVAHKNEGRGCLICSGKKVVKSNCLVTTHPAIANQWHPTLNKNLSPKNYTARNRKYIWWKCPKGKDHEWKSQIYLRALKGSNCHICSGLKVVPSTSLATTHPKIAKQWHPKKNGKLTPHNISAGSSQRIWWQCNIKDDHVWPTSPHHRTSRKTGCPFCTLNPQSKQELTILFELKSIFKEIPSNGYKVKIKNKFWTIDIYIPEINLGIEFDGKYWHKNKTVFDRIKTKSLEANGYKTLRIREQPLIKTRSSDLISKLPFKGKKVVDNVLIYILKNFTIDLVHEIKIKKYLAISELQNTKKLNNYIERKLKKLSRNK